MYKKFHKLLFVSDFIFKLASAKLKQITIRIIPL